MHMCAHMHTHILSPRSRFSLLPVDVSVCLHSSTAGTKECDPSPAGPKECAHPPNYLHSLPPQDLKNPFTPNAGGVRGSAARPSMPFPQMTPRSGGACIILALCAVLLPLLLLCPPARMPFTPSALAHPGLRSCHPPVCGAKKLPWAHAAPLYCRLPSSGAARGQCCTSTRT